jgi:small-conductance mechanosensitive channel
MRALVILLLALLPLLGNAQTRTVSAGRPDSVVTVQLAGQKDTLYVQQLPAIENRAATDEAQPPDISQIFSFWKIFWSLVFLTGGFFAIRLIIGLIDIWAERSTTNRITLKGLVPVARIVGWTLIIIIIIAGILQPPAATVLAIMASLGLAVGFAAQDILKNIFGGITILLDKPFQVGDKIEIGSYYGEVVEIGLRSTRLVTPDDSLVTVPNGELMNESLSNSNSGEANCQVVAEIYLPLTVDTQFVRQLATEAAHVSKYIYQNKPVAVLFFNEMQYGRSVIKMRLKAYVLDIRYEFAFKSDMTELVLQELKKEGVLSADNS